MTTIGTIYIACGIFYAIACVMDGQDVKPQWKKWVGKKLEKASNYFFPINYVTKTKVVKEYVPLPSPTLFERDVVKVQSQTLISEGDLMMAMRHMPYMMEKCTSTLINEYKSKCLNAIFRQIAAEDVVNFEVDRETARPSIIVRAWLYVGRKR